MKNKIKKNLSTVFSKKTDKASESSNNDTLISLGFEVLNDRKDVFPLINPSSDGKANKINQNKSGLGQATVVLPNEESYLQSKSDSGQSSMPPSTERVYSQTGSDYEYSNYSTENSEGGSSNSWDEIKYIETDSFDWDKPKENVIREVDEFKIMQAINLSEKLGKNYEYKAGSFKNNNNLDFRMIPNLANFHGFSDPNIYIKATYVPSWDRSTLDNGDKIADISGEESLYSDSSNTPIICYEQVKRGEESLSSDNSTAYFLRYEEVKLPSYLDNIFEETESVGKTLSHNDDC